MWNTNGKRSIVLNIVIVLLILALLGGLVFAMLRVREANAARDEELSQIYVQQKQVLDEARQEQTDAIQREYEKDMETVARYVPGIVCWGDKTTVAASTGLNYPYVLQTYVNTYLCDIYDFSSSIENAGEFARLKWDDYKVSIPVVNMGAGEESTYTILGRAGTVPYVVSRGFVIPADVSPVPIEFESQASKTVTPLTGGDGGINPVTINGIEGTLSIDTEAYNFNKSLSYFFTRSTPGQETSVDGGAVIKTYASDLYKDYIHVVLMGIYGEYTNGEDLVKQVRSLLSRQTQNTDRFIILGPYINSAYSFSTYQLDAIDSAMMQAFGNRYISVRKYLVGDGYADADISPTSEDKYYINQNVVPPSFKVASHSDELNSRAHKLIGRLVFNRMDSLGYFDEIKSELNLTETTKKILKDSPNYFDNMIKNILR